MGDLMHPDIVIDHCADWSSDLKKSNGSKREDGDSDHHHGQSPADFLYRPLSSSSSFELPLSADSLFLFSRGATAGLFKLVQSPDLDPSEGVAKVVVVAKYRGHSTLKHVKVCAVTRGATDKGVVIIVNFLSSYLFFFVPPNSTVFLAGPKTVETCACRVRSDCLPPKGRGGFIPLACKALSDGFTSLRPFSG